jgi:hypothetical protein
MNRGKIHWSVCEESLSTALTGGCVVGLWSGWLMDKARGQVLHHHISNLFLFGGLVAHLNFSQFHKIFGRKICAHEKDEILFLRLSTMTYWCRGNFASRFQIFITLALHGIEYTPSRSHHIYGKGQQWPMSNRSWMFLGLVLPSSSQRSY